MKKTTPPKPLKVIHSAELFGKEKEIIILHEGNEYRMKITKASKLILNK
jgi:hemin uptake protein HemP